MATSREVTPLRLRAEMARRGLLRTQLGPYEDPDTERWVEPTRDKEMIAEAWSFLAWLDKATAHWHG